MLCVFEEADRFSYFSAEDEKDVAIHRAIAFYRGLMSNTRMWGNPKIACQYLEKDRGQVNLQTEIECYASVEVESRSWCR